MMGNAGMTAERAKDILGHKDEKLEDIHQKMQMLYQELKELEQPDELLEAAALQSCLEKTQQKGIAPADNLNILYKYYRQREERVKEIRQQMWKLSEEAEEIRRLWGCFFVLQAPYYGILSRLYVKKELYAVAEETSGYSHRMFEKRRKEGLEVLAAMFNSPYSSVELMERGAGAKWN